MIQRISQRRKFRNIDRARELRVNARLRKARMARAAIRRSSSLRRTREALRR